MNAGQYWRARSRNTSRGKNRFRGKNFRSRGAAAEVFPEVLRPRARKCATPPRRVGDDFSPAGFEFALIDNRIGRRLSERSEEVAKTIKIRMRIKIRIGV